jgi:hypothetical protein
MTKSNHLTQSKMTSPPLGTPRSISNSMIRCELAGAASGTRFRRVGRARWCKRRHYLVTRACSGEIAVAVHGDPWCGLATVTPTAQWNALEMHRLTLMLPRWSPEWIADGSDPVLADSGGLLQRGTGKIRQLNPFQSNSFNWDAYLVEAELWGLSL